MGVYDHYECDGQMSIEDFLKPEGELRSCCSRVCEYEFGSLRCFEKRGYMYDYQKRRWLRNIKGEIIKMNNPECDWKPKEPKMPVDIRGLMDDAVCPKCGWYFLDEQTDCDVCPNCGQPVDWTKWHQIND